MNEHLPEYLTPLVHAATKRRVATGVTFVTQGDTDKDVYILLEGSVQMLLLSPNGRQIQMGQFDAPAVFGHFAAVIGQARSASLVTTTPCLFAVISGAAFQKLAAENPDCRRFVFENLGRCLLDANEAVRRIATLSPDARLAAYILEHADTNQICAIGTQQDLADSLAITRETVTRLLSAWRKRGLITVARGRITVLKADILQETALNPD